MAQFKVTFGPDNKVVEARQGESLLACAARAGIHLNTSCGGDGLCGRCRVIVSGASRSEPSAHLSAEDRAAGHRLACRTWVEGDLAVVVPERSNLGTPAIATEDERLLKGKRLSVDVDDWARSQRDVPVYPIDKPITKKIYIASPPPTGDDRISDLDRLVRSLAAASVVVEPRVSVALIRTIGRVLRESGWKVTVTVFRRGDTWEIIAIEPGDTSGRNFGIAFDIGTTTIVGQLIDMTTGEERGSKTTLNRQAAYGDDVITRIMYGSSEEGLGKLHSVVADAMNGIIDALCRDQGIIPADITAIVCAGNTTMIHLFLEIDPKSIRIEPYIPAVNLYPPIRAAEIGINADPRAFLFIVPGVASYVGGDIVAGVLSSGVGSSKKLSVLLDIGTNGEIALGSAEWLIAAAASAGPAFEGSGVTCGMRATHGAAQRVRIDESGKVMIETIGGGKPRGICGSGYIDLLAELLSHKLLGRDGKLASSSVSRRIRRNAYGAEFVVVGADETSHGEDIVITEDDIENLKRSKAAIYSAASTLLTKMGLEWSAVESFYVAGGFGTYLDVEKAITIGLLPDIERSRFEFIGNSSLAGARLLLLSGSAGAAADEIARKMTYLELGSEPLYMDEYVKALFFPHTDLDRFKSLLGK